MKFDYSDLCEKILEKYGAKALFARDMHISEKTVNLRLSGKTDWSQKEIDRALRVLGISKNEVSDYFFRKKVQF